MLTGGASGEGTSWAHAASGKSGSANSNNMAFRGTRILFSWTKSLTRREHNRTPDKLADHLATFPHPCHTLPCLWGNLQALSASDTLTVAASLAFLCA